MILNKKIVIIVVGCTTVDNDIDKKANVQAIIKNLIAYVINIIVAESQLVRGYHTGGHQSDYHKKIPPKLCFIFWIKHTQTPVDSRMKLIIGSISKVIHIESCEKEILFSHRLDVFDFILPYLASEPIF
jgi:hypothetical protein